MPRSSISRDALDRIGAAYILWLAWTIWRDKPHAGKGGAFKANTFQSGMLLQFVNVKIILYGITAMSSYVLPHYHSFPAIAFYTLLVDRHRHFRLCHMDHIRRNL